MNCSTQPRGRQKTSPFRSSRCLLILEQLEARLCLTVPAYSSLPGANHTIYLDFDGHVTQNTQWNSYFGVSTINSPAYDTDSSPSTLSAAELADIEQAWNRIAEDYIPFNVNVTTVDPGVNALVNSGAGDTQWGIRVIMTNDTQGTGAGGIGYINSFNWNVDTGVFVYVKGGKNVAEAGSHEVGHSLGLAHDGTASAGYYTGHGSGETSWAPLMGVGYYTNVTTWDKGEYYGSNNAGSGANYNKGPDDLAIITTYNGFGYRADDVGNSTSSSTPLSVSGTTVSGAGIITTTSDVDFYSFTTGAGQVNLNVNPFTPGPNLDIRADLFDASGNLVATSNSATTLSANFNLTLPAGQYYLKIDGTGFGTPGANPPSGYSDYASLGRYFISGTVVSAGQMAEFSVNDLSVNEAAGTATFTVTLTGTLSSNATVNFATANGTAVAPGDYISTSGTLTFTPGGSTTQTVTVSLVDDTSTEATETFTLNLSNASGAVIADGQGLATILDNDLTPTLSIAASDANKAEGTGATATPFTFTVTRSGSTSGTSSVNWSVTGVGGSGGATTANDFVNSAFPSGTVTFAAGESAKTVTVNVLADSTKEKNEKFRVTLSNASNAVLSTSTADGTVVNDDGGKPGRGLLPDMFPLPGQETAPEYQHDHDEEEHESTGTDLASSHRQQVVQAFLTQQAPRFDAVVSRLLTQVTMAVGSPGVTVNSTTMQVKTRLQDSLGQPASVRISSATMDALTTLSNSGRTTLRAASLVDQLFTSLKR